MRLADKVEEEHWFRCCGRPLGDVPTLARVAEVAVAAVEAAAAAAKEVCWLDRFNDGRPEEP